MKNILINKILNDFTKVDCNGEGAGEDSVTQEVAGIPHHLFKLSDKGRLVTHFFAGTDGQLFICNERPNYPSDCF